MLSHAMHQQIEAETAIMALRQELSEIHKTVAVEVSLRTTAEDARNAILDELAHTKAALEDQRVAHHDELEQLKAQLMNEQQQCAILNYFFNRE